MRLNITGEEIANFIEQGIKEFNKNPLINLNILSHLGMVMTSIGMLKSSTTLKLIGDLLTEAPDRLRPLISLRYSLVGTIGEFQTMISTLAENIIKELTSTILELATMIKRGEASETNLVAIVGKLYDLLVIKTPLVTLDTEE